MVSFIPKRLQVFVSSTYTDLIEERQAAVEAILTIGHIPAGMELFTAGDESQLEVIKQWIDESDIYLLILGGRYGSIEPNTGKSYTQIEYEYALSSRKECFACVIKEDALENRVKNSGTAVIETSNPQKLKEFRELVKSKVVRFWEDSKDIKVRVTEALSHLARNENLIVWVHPSQEANIPALADEITRLSKENAILRNQIANIDNSDSTINGVRFSELKSLLEDKGILDFFTSKRYELLSNYFPFAKDEKEYFATLLLYGLVEPAERSSLRLSDSGREFLNKLAVQTLNN